MQDAINLGWKLSAVIQEKSHEKILDGYEEERLKVAKRLLNITDKKTRLMFMMKNPIAIFIRNCIFSFLSSIPSVKKKMAAESAETDITYRHSTYVVNKLHPSKFQAGDRIPNGRFADNSQLYEKLTRDRHTLLTCERDIQSKISLAILDQLTIIYLSPEEIPLRRLLGLIKGGYCLIRPDLYIAYLGVDLKDLNPYFSLFFIANERKNCDRT